MSQDVPLPSYTRGQLLARLITEIATNLDLTQSQRDRAVSAYNAVGAVLSNSPESELKASVIIPQGSFAIGTVVRPVDDSTGFDVDIVCRLAADRSLPPGRALQLIGDRLRRDRRYEAMLRPKCRCWRLQYEGEFHLDVAPVVPFGSGDLIPDRELSSWLPTHPQAYASWFNEIATRALRQYLRETRVLAAQVEPFPEQLDNVGVLRRMIQLMKRFRELWLVKNTSRKPFSPISIIITTLATYAFQDAVGRAYGDEFELMRAMVVSMPRYIEHRPAPGGAEHWVKSPVAEENFANRWQSDPRWKLTFDAWHSDMVALLDSAASRTGLHEIGESLSLGLGDGPTRKALNSLGDALRTSREAGQARFTGGSGVLASSSAAATIRPHTFFGE